MGCASSTPMVQTAGSDMLKAATHVADDATKTAEDAVQGVKDSLGKSLDTAKETVTTKVEEVKHEVENTIKEKSGQLDEAKNTLMEKLHLGSHTASQAATKAKEEAEAAKEEVYSTVTGAGDELKQNMETLHNQGIDTINEMESSVLGQTDTETDSLRTSTPEPEIERAMANTKAKRMEGNETSDGNDTPIPTYSELENLNNELLNSQQLQQAVSDMTPSAPTNDQLMTMTADVGAAAADIKTPLSATATTTSSASTTSSSITSVTTTLDTTKSSTMHITPIPIASATSIATAIASSTASAFHLGHDSQVPPAITETSGETETVIPDAAAIAKAKAHKARVEKLAAEKAHQRRLIQKLQDEKRPSTTEWERFADTLAHFRKYNPHDAFRRGGTLTKFNGPHMGGMNMREKSLLGRLGDDDSSDNNSNRGRASPGLRGSARLGGRVQRANNRPNSANQRGSVNTTVTTAIRRNSGGRKFDFNPNRSRLNNNGQPLNVSSDNNFSFSSAYRLSPTNGSHSHTLTQTHLHSHSHTPSPPPPAPPSHKHESVKSHPEMRTQHSHLGKKSTRQRLDSLHYQQELQCEEPHYGHAHATGGSSMPPDAIVHTKIPHYHLPPLTRESSNTSLFSLHSHQGQNRSFRSTYDLTKSPRPTVNPPSVRNSSSFLATPRGSPFYLSKSYTDLYFTSSGNKENSATIQTDASLGAIKRQVRDKSPYKVRERCEVCSHKYSKT